MGTAKFLECNQKVNGATSVIQYIRTKKETAALSPCQKHIHGPMWTSSREMLEAESQARSRKGNIWSASYGSALPSALTQSSAFSG